MAESKEKTKVCPRLPNMDNLKESVIKGWLNNPVIINLFDKKCSKSENESYNKWREKLFVHLFNLKKKEDKLHLLDNEDWRLAWTNIKEIETSMKKFEGLINLDGTPKHEIKITETKLILQAGQGNYDFDYVVKFEKGEPKTYHYEYKHHTPEKLPQLLSLYDCKNPIVGNPIEKGKYKGKFKTKYLCLQVSYSKDNIFEFWKNKPYWLYYFNNYLMSGELKEKIKEKKDIDLPEISENDYFCFVKSTDGIPFRTSHKTVNELFKKYSIKMNEIDTLDKLNDITLSDGTDEDNEILKIWKKKEQKKIAKWIKYSKKKKYDDKYKVLKFFHILYLCKDKKWFVEITKKSVVEYLNNFINDKPAKLSLVERLFENIRLREAGKRFIFYYGKENGNENKLLWKMSAPYTESFENPIKVSQGGESKVQDDGIVKVNDKKGKTRIVIKTASGNRLDFNLRWANTIGIQNSAWQMNIFKGETGITKLVPEIVDEKYWAEREAEEEEPEKKNHSITSIQV